MNRAAFDAYLAQVEQDRRYGLEPASSDEQAFKREMGYPRTVSSPPWQLELREDEDE